MRRFLLCVAWLMGLSAPLLHTSTALAQTSGVAATTELEVLQGLANEGHRSASFNLGVLYDTGRGVAQDFRQAARWYRVAAKQGHAAAQFNLGGLYFEGQGVDKDLVRASVWFTLAAVSGFDGAARNRNSVAALLNAEQRSLAQRLVRQCQQTELRDCD